MLFRSPEAALVVDAGKGTVDVAAAGADAAACRHTAWAKGDGAAFAALAAAVGAGVLGGLDG